VLAKTRTQRPRFAPGTPGKALYSDTNYQLLGHILTHVTGQPIAALCRQHICEPLGLQHTYLYTDPTDTTPVPLRYRGAVLQVPQAMASFGPDGGVVSTATEQLRFIRAFYGGALFPTHYLPNRHSSCKHVLLFGGILASDVAFYYALLQVL
jgi:CubicO group peptidase (beta-lactamase class C family)